MALAIKAAQAYEAVLGGGWANPQNAGLLDDNVYASAAVNASTKSTKFYNFDFGLPDDATINSITVYFQRKLDGTLGANTFTMATLKSGASVGTDTSITTEPTADTNYSKQLNGTWTAAELNDNTIDGFALLVAAISSGSRTHTMDVLYVIVDYDTAEEDLFTYTGSVQTMTLSAGCTYELRCCGAQGRPGYQGSVQAQGGLGGLVIVEYTPEEDTEINIFVGSGAGLGWGTAGGYNGGGAGHNYGGAYFGGGGGGGSDIRIGGTALEDRVLIAGGGGGGGSTSTQYGGVGGGLVGGAGYAAGAGAGGTQLVGGTAGGALGVGGNAVAASEGGAGGGGGYYGGGGADGDGTRRGGGGGSGYLGTFEPNVFFTGFWAGNGEIGIMLLSAPVVDSPRRFCQII